MACCHLYAPIEGGENAFSVDTTAIVFGRGCVSEVGLRARELGLVRLAVLTDPIVRSLPIMDTVLRALKRAGLDAVVYDEVRVEPTDVSFRAAARFASEGRFDGYVSVGGGSVIDTAKAANLYATHPADFSDYVNAPVGAGRPVPGPVRPHIACPTTSGTGSESTGIAVFDDLSLEAKTGIAHPFLKPSGALIDPDATDTLPNFVVAASGFDVLSHALESYTARPFTRRSADQPRPMSQGANPWSDIGCKEALRLSGHYLVRAVHDAHDREAREKMMWAATLAGIAFGNAGVHVPHGMAYAVAGLAQDDRPVAHGVSVIVNAPAVFRFLADAHPERHLEAAALLGADVTGAKRADAGELVANELCRMMKACEIPNGISGVGFRLADIPALTEGAYLQQRLLQNAPKPVDQAQLSGLFGDALTCW